MLVVGGWACAVPYAAVAGLWRRLSVAQTLGGPNLRGLDGGKSIEVYVRLTMQMKCECGRGEDESRWCDEVTGASKAPWWPLKTWFLRGSKPKASKLSSEDP